MRTTLLLTYAGKDDAIASARRLMQEAQVEAVKLEGGGNVAAIVEHVTQQLAALNA